MCKIHEKKIHFFPCRLLFNTENSKHKYKTITHTHASTFCCNQLAPFFKFKLISMTDFEIQLDQEMESETPLVSTQTTKKATKKPRTQRNGPTSTIRKAGRPYKRMAAEKLTAYITQLQDRVDVAETKYKLYCQRLKKYTTEQAYRDEENNKNSVAP